MTSVDKPDILARRTSRSGAFLDVGFWRIGGQPVSRGVDAALAIVCVLGVMLAAYLVVRADIDPLSWIDEVSYADPFLNAADGRGMTSGSWAGQPYGQLWASNSPLYGLIAMPALWAFGPSVHTWRGIWGVLYVALSALFLRSLAGFGLVRSPVIIFLGGVAMMTAPCMYFLVTSGRGIDIACVAVAVTAVASLALLRGPAKAWGLFCAGFMMPWAGIQLFPAAAAVLACGLFVDWRKTWSVGLVLGLGAASGLFTLFCVLGALGVLKVFLAQTFASGFTSVGAVAQTVLVPGAKSISLERFNVLRGMADLFNAGPETMALSAAALTNALAALAIRRRSKVTPWVIFLVVVGAVAMPCFMVIAGRWLYYYFWMAFLPLLAAAMCDTGASSPESVRVRSLHMVAMAAVGIACAFSSYGPTSIQRYDRMKQVAVALDKLVARTARADDVALVDFTVYFRFRPRVARIYTPSYGEGKLFRTISDEEQQQMTLVVVQRADIPKVVGKKLQGNWVECDQEMMGDFDREDLVVFRRAPHSDGDGKAPDRE